MENTNDQTKEEKEVMIDIIEAVFDNTNDSTKKNNNDVFRTMGDMVQRT